MSTLTAWALTSGEIGMRTQARGLAAAIAGEVVEKTAPPLTPWRWLRQAAGAALPAPGLAPPWPDVLVTCGRRSAALSRAIRKASRGATFTVHIQDPRTAPDAFDLIVAMNHDQIGAGPNVLKVATALHDVTPESLRLAAAAWSPVFEPLGRPLVGVAIGGDLRGRPFTLADARRLLDGLTRLRHAGGASLAITPSRRTPAAVRAMLAEAFDVDPRVFLWDLAGANPYRGILALADRLVVTGDSVSMISEAIATDHPVEVLDLGFPRHAGFLSRLVASGRVRRFEGDPRAPGRADPVNATDAVAQAVERLLQARTGVVGKAS